MKRLLLLILCLGFHLAKSQQRIVYIANEGILIENNGQKVLIDALFDDYYKDYLVPNEEIIQDMREKTSPYESVDFFLSTHAHRDHFYSHMVFDFLKTHQETYFIGSKQAVDSLMIQTDLSTIQSNVLGYTKSAGWQSLEKDGIGLSTAYVRHGGRQNYGVDNFIFLVDIGGKKILHIGDSEMDPTHFSKLELSDKSIDVALVPYWFLAYPPGQQIIARHIQPKRLVGIHYPKVGDPKSLALIREKFPNAVIFMKSGEKMEL